MSEKFANVEDYLESLTPVVRSVVEEVRATIHAALPGAEETISYNLPTVTIQGRRIVHYAGWANHVSLYPAPDDEELRAELAPYLSGKGTVRFPVDRPVPLGLIVRIVQGINEGPQSRS